MHRRDQAGGELIAQWIGSALLGNSSQFLYMFNLFNIKSTRFSIKWQIIKFTKNQKTKKSTKKSIFKAICIPENEI
jgi:hypothetical protein